MMIQQTSSSTRIEQWAIRGMAVIVLSLIGCICFFTLRTSYVDELGLFNPVYTLVETGKMTYPVHYQFHSMPVHPPLHYWMIGELMKLGISFYVAEVIPILGISLLALVIIERGQFSPLVKFGLLMGLLGSVVLFFLPILPTFLYTVRPDLHLAIAWYAGLIALESGRINRWHPKLLLLGSFLLVYSSTLHYYAAPGFLGLLVYAFWIIRDLGFAKAKWLLLVLAAGPCLIGIPYAVLVLIPGLGYLPKVLNAVQQDRGVPAALTRHFATYACWQEAFSTHSKALVSVLMLPVLGLKIPAAIAGTALLSCFPAARGIGWASLPLTLFILLYAQGKSMSYYLPEILVYLAGISMLLGQLSITLGKKLLPGKAAQFILVALIGTVSIVALQNWFSGIRPHWTWKPIHEMEIARAANQEILGPDALVGSRLGLWYASGAAKWFDISRDVLWKPELPKDIKAYFGTFDAIADHAFLSQETFNQQRKSLISWYLDGTLKLKGFYFGDTSQVFANQLLTSRFAAEIQGYNDAAISQVLLAVDRPQVLVGYGYRQDQLYRFEAQPRGDYAFMAMTCPYGVLGDGTAMGAKFFNRFYVPNPENLIPGHSDRFPPAQDVSVFVVAQKAYNPALTARCQLVQSVVGSLQTVELMPLITKMRQADQTMQFYRTIAEARAATVRLASSTPLYQAEGNWQTWQAANPTVRIKQPDAQTIAVKTNASTFDFQLQSPPISLAKNTSYRVDVSGLIHTGGLSIHFLDTTANRPPIHTASFCAPNANVSIQSQFMIDSGAAEKMAISISNCSQDRPVISKFSLNRLQIWPVANSKLGLS